MKNILIFVDSRQEIARPINVNVN